MCSCYSNLECCVTFSGVKLSIRSFVLLHVDSGFYKQSVKIDNYHKIKEWIDYSIGQSTVIQELDKKKPTLSSSNQTQSRRR